MDIAEKVLQLKDDFDGVYSNGYEDGKNSVAPLERYLKGGKFLSLNIFGKAEVELNLDSWTDGFTNLFQIINTENVNNTVEHLTITTPCLPKSIQQMCYASSSCFDHKLKRITCNFSTQNCTTFLNAFGGMRALETIDGEPFDYSSATSATYINGVNNCISLVNFRVVASSIKLSISFVNCSELSTDTIQSIIDGLADLTGGTAQTLTLHADVGAKLTEEQKATITAKNWELVY